MTKRLDSLRSESGFTIIEVMVAAMLLVLGLLGVAKMADQANVASDQSKARVGATNLARELLENARTFDYENLQGTLPAGSGATNLENAFANTGITDALPSTTGFQIKRRGITYTVNVFTCVFDDSHDGVRASPGAGNQDLNAAGPYCLGSPTAGSGTTTDSNPDDSRKVEVSVTWSLFGLVPSCRNAGQTTTSGGTGGQGRSCVTQSELIANPSGGLGPAIKTFVKSSPGGATGPVESGNTVTMSVTTATGAQSVTWISDEGKSGTATSVNGSNGTGWTFDWPLGVNSPHDGTHVLTAQAFLLNAGGVPRDAPVSLNRFIPAVPQGLTGGVDGRLSAAAAISWNANSDQDIFGYTVYRASGSTPDPSTDVPVCSTASVSATLCYDAPSDLQSFATTGACLNPVTPGDACINYYVVPFDSQWTTVTNPTSYDGTVCQGNPWGTVTVPAPPVSASRSVAPITDTSINPLWPTARAGCPSAYISIDYTDLVQNHAPDPPSNLTCASDNGQPRIGWTPPATPDQDGDDVVQYRIYRDPPGGGTPAYNDPAVNIGFGTSPSLANTYTDSSPTGGTAHDYWISAVDARFAESAAQHIQWTAASCP